MALASQVTLLSPLNGGSTLGGMARAGGMVFVGWCSRAFSTIGSRCSKTVTMNGGRWPNCCVWFCGLVAGGSAVQADVDCQGTVACLDCLTGLRRDFTSAARRSFHSHFESVP